MTNEAKYLPSWRSSVVGSQASIRDALEAISQSGALMACVCDEANHLLGIVTDSDIRRALLQGWTLEESIENCIQKSPITASISMKDSELLALAKECSVREIPLLDCNGRLADIFMVLVHQEKHRSESPRASAYQEPLPNHMLILAGGLGTRLRPVVNDRPKPLALVGNRPIIETLIHRAQLSGIRNFYVAVNYLASQIEEHLNDARYEHLNIRVIREHKKLGTAGSLGYISEELEHPIFVGNADVLTTVPFHRMLHYHQKESADITCAVRSHTMSVPYGVVDVDGGEIKAIREKPRSHFLINTGIYIINPDLCCWVRPDEYLDMPTLLQKAINRQKKVVPFYLHEYWLDIGKPEDFHKANTEFDEHFEQE